MAIGIEQLNQLALDGLLATDEQLKGLIGVEKATILAKLATLDNAEKIALGLENLSINGKFDGEVTNVDLQSVLVNASNTTNGLMDAQDKIKLDAIALNANNYVHPIVHPASIITETDEKKFTSLAEELKLAGISPEANKYLHPSTHSANMIDEDSNRRFVSDIEKATWNDKMDAVNAYTKEETDLRFQELVGAAPDALNTLIEIGASLNNDPDFAATMTTELAKKVNVTDFTSANILAKVKTVDGADSGLDADTVDGLQASDFARDTHTHATLYLGLNAQATDADTVDGLHASEFAKVSHGHVTLNASGNAAITGNGVFGGTITASQVFNAVYNDYAEYFLKEGELEAGDIVVRVDSDKEVYTKSTEALSNAVVGVYSDDYAQCIGGDLENAGNPEEQEKKYAPIGMAGRVKVKVVGAVKRNQLIVSSDIAGVGKAIDSKEYVAGTVIGKAMENYDGSEGVKRIKMLIMNA